MEKILNILSGKKILKKPFLIKPTQTVTRESID